MTQRQRNRGVRPAFTLIEILVVITIIAILVSLTAAAVMRGLGKGQETVASSEIGELQAKLANVIKNPANPLVFVPSRLHLSKTNNYNAALPLDRDSVAFLQARFGKHACFDFQNPPPGGQFIDWNGDGNASEELYLEGEQCLVFHLGGVPVYSPANNVNGPIAMVGFSNDPQNPAKTPGAGEKRQGPYFEFQSNRLRQKQSVIPGNTAGAVFPEYLDPWVQTGGNAKRQPFAFFASYNVEGAGLYDKYGTSDCPSLLTHLGLPADPAVLPYQFPGGLWLNPSSFQIISAGQDGHFGIGGATWSRAGTTDQQYGKDDQSNFSAHLLGVAP
jgi:prepilin-type N-terminal cleavage/methylation domain-containing protein